MTMEDKITIEMLISELRKAISIMCDDMDAAATIAEKETIHQAILRTEEEIVEAEELLQKLE